MPKRERMEKIREAKVALTSSNNLKDEAEIERLKMLVVEDRARFTQEMAEYERKIDLNQEKLLNTG